MWIAEERVVFVHPGGARVDGRIAIGMPQQNAEDASCEIAIEGAEQELARATFKLYGETPLQALLLAVQFQAMQLHSFLARGGRVLEPTQGEDLPLAAYFGPLMRAPVITPEDRAMFDADDEDDDDDE